MRRPRAGSIAGAWAPFPNASCYRPKSLLETPMPRHSFRRRPPRQDQSNELIFGRNPVLEALRGASATVDKVLVVAGSQGMGPVLDEARAHGVPVEMLGRDALDALSGSGNHQGVAICAKPFAYVTFEDLVEAAPAMVVLLDGILDPQNLGAIIRSAEVLGAGGVVLPKDRSASVTPAAVRASSGAAIHLPVAQVVNLVRAIEVLKSKGFWVVGLDAGGTSRFQDLPAFDRVVLVVGGEGRGMRPLVVRACDFVVGIPVRGRVTSLNAGAASAIALHELATRLPAATS